MTVWIGVDFDDTLRHESGAPIPVMMERVKMWVDAGIEVRIVTARLDPSRDDESKQVAFIRTWLLMNLGFTLPMQWGKSTGMLELWDDKVVRVESGTGRKLSPSYLDELEEVEDEGY